MSGFSPARGITTACTGRRRASRSPARRRAGCVVCAKGDAGRWAASPQVG